MERRVGDGVLIFGVGGRREVAVTLTCVVGVGGERQFAPRAVVAGGGAYA